MGVRAAFVMLAALAACGPRPAPPAEDQTPQAAVRVVQRYYALVESGQLTEAAALRTNRITEDVRPYDTMQAEVGPALRLREEGDAVRVRVPVAIHGRFSTGGEYRRGGVVTLVRRIGPGLGAREQRWRIERIDLRS